MSTKVKGIVAAVLALLVAAFSWYVAYSDNDASTTPNTQAVVAAGSGVVSAITASADSGTSETKTSAVETTESK
jgi:hypothetical protein